MKGVMQLGPAQTPSAKAPATTPVVDKTAFATQLAKVKAGKKPEVTDAKAVKTDKTSKAVPAPDAAPQPTAPDAPSLIQILAALLTGAQPQAPISDAPVATSPQPAIAQAAEAATTQLAATAQDALLQQMVAVKPELATLAPAEPPLTPLEQAVHDMLSELADKAPEKSSQLDDAAATFAGTLAPAAPLASIDHDAPQSAPTAPVQAQQPAELVSQNHAHLVFDDANGRVVMTVAVRGSEVNVSVRASDDATAAALARNAGSLDEAMRGRGLALAQFDSQRDLAREQNQDKPTYAREREPKRQNERFTLEENT